MTEIRPVQELMDIGKDIVNDLIKKEINQAEFMLIIRELENQQIINMLHSHAKGGVIVCPKL